MKLSIREHLARASSKYRARKSNENLRWLLTWKARVGRWDARYCGYYAIPTENVTPWVRRFLTRAYAAGLVPTATTNGAHAVGSYHYSGHAGDVGLRRDEIGTAKGQRKLERFQRAEFKRWSSGVSHATELIGPNNYLVVLRGRHSPLAEGGELENAHDNHVHGAHA